MLNDKLRELEQTRAHLAKLEDEVRESLNKELASLPEKFGFDSTAEFIAAVEQATGGSRRRGRPPGSATPGRAAGGKRRRAKITDETRAQVKKMVEAGKTGGEIAKALGISLPSVQNVKKALGLVQRRK